MPEPYFVIEYAQGKLSSPMNRETLEDHISSFNVGGKIFLCTLTEIPGLEARVHLHWPNEAEETPLPSRADPVQGSPVQSVSEGDSGEVGAPKGGKPGPIFPRARRGRPKKLLGVSN